MNLIKNSLTPLDSTKKVHQENTKYFLVILQTTEILVLINAIA